MSSSITDEKISGEQQQPAGRKLYYNTSTFAEPPLVDEEGNPINYEPEVYNPDHEKLYHNPSLPAQSIQDTRDDELLERVYSQDQGVEYEEDEEDKPNLSAASIKSYALTRFTSLLHIHEFSWENVNPIPELRKMTWQNWNYFFMGYFAWLSAAWAFFCVSVSVAPLAELYDRPTKDITWGWDWCYLFVQQVLSYLVYGQISLPESGRTLHVCSYLSLHNSVLHGVTHMRNFWA